MGITQVVKAYKKQGHKVIGHESMTPIIITGAFLENEHAVSYPKGTQRIAVIYFD